MLPCCYLLLCVESVDTVSLSTAIYRFLLMSALRLSAPKQPQAIPNKPKQIPSNPKQPKATLSNLRQSHENRTIFESNWQESVLSYYDVENSRDENSGCSPKTKTKMFGGFAFGLFNGADRVNMDFILIRSEDVRVLKHVTIPYQV